MGWPPVWMIPALAVCCCWRQQPLRLLLWLGLRSAEVICGKGAAPAWTALPAAAIAASRAFSHGGSAEELLLPLLAAALFGAVSTLRASRPMPLRRVVLHGFWQGCALWLKYTVLGFLPCLGGAAGGALSAARLARDRSAVPSGAYLGGMALAHAAVGRLLRRAGARWGLVHLLLL